MKKLPIQITPCSRIHSHHMRKEIHPIKERTKIAQWTIHVHHIPIVSKNLYDANEQVTTITIKGKHPACNVVTHHRNITVQGAPSIAAYMPKQYNLVDQLDKMPTLLSILEILHLSPSHKTILDQALQEVSVPSNLNTYWFQAMVGSLKSSPCWEWQCNHSTTP